MNSPSLSSTVRQTVDNLIRRPYSKAFFSGLATGSRPSAEVIVPLVMELVQPRSVVDVGCGVGTWLSVFAENGVSDMLGIDGDYVPRKQLEIPSEQFQSADLGEPLQVGRRFDLAMSLEVAEHLPPASSEQFVASLVKLADVVLFSAAIPKQRGSEHVNERWQSWWAERFGEHGFAAVDCVRRRIWSNPNVEWWYAQNVIVYVSRERLRRDARLRQEHELMGTSALSLVHPALYVKWRQRLRDLLRPR
jgi:SAM-dependent methyltransferase